MVLHTPSQASFCKTYSTHRANTREIDVLNCLVTKPDLPPVIIEMPDKNPNSQDCCWKTWKIQHKLNNRKKKTFQISFMSNISKSGTLKLLETLTNDIKVDVLSCISLNFTNTVHILLLILNVYTIKNWCKIYSTLLVT